jgi:hypothetical protein
MGGIYEVRRWDGLRWHDISSFIKIVSDVQELLGGHRQNADRISLLLLYNTVWVTDGIVKQL